jgi:hypothetical protein
MESRPNPSLGFELRAGAIQPGAQSLAADATGTGDTMMNSNTLALALFALLVNSTALLSVSM